MHAVKRNKWPGPSLVRYIGWAAMGKGDIEYAGILLGEQPKQFKPREDGLAYKCLFLILSNGRLGTITELTEKPGILEIALELKQTKVGVVAYKNELDEVVYCAGLDKQSVQTFAHPIWRVRRVGVLSE